MDADARMALKMEKERTMQTWVEAAEAPSRTLSANS